MGGALQPAAGGGGQDLFFVLELEVRMRRGGVVVRYEGCSLEILPGCTAPGGYAHSGFSRKRDAVTIRDVDDLYGQMPVGAGELEARLGRVGEF